MLRTRTPATIAAASAIVVLAAAVLLAMGRPPICTCGYVALWHGRIDAGNSQHLLDWYSPSHMIHGLLFYGAGWLLLRRRRIATRFLIALAIEAAWEIVENSPWIIDRYRTATMALGYTGDSVLNSLSDIGCMAAGFWLARRLLAAGAGGWPSSSDPRSTVTGVPPTPPASGRGVMTCRLAAPIYPAWPPPRSMR